MSEEKDVLEKIESEEVSISWHTMSSTEVLQKLDTPEEKGLSTEEVKARQERFGPNALTEAPPTSFWAMLCLSMNNL